MSFTLDIDIKEGVNYPHLGIGVADNSYSLTAVFYVFSVEKTSLNTADAKYTTVINGVGKAVNRFEFPYGAGDELFTTAERYLRTIL